MVHVIPPIKSTRYPFSSEAPKHIKSWIVLKIKRQWPRPYPVAHYTYIYLNTNNTMTCVQTHHGNHNNIIIFVPGDFFVFHLKRVNCRGKTVDLHITAVRHSLGCLV